VKYDLMLVSFICTGLSQCQGEEGHKKDLWVELVTLGLYHDELLAGHVKIVRRLKFFRFDFSPLDTQLESQQ